MPSDALRVRPHKCDGCYRPHRYRGMFVLAAYTRQGDQVTRTIHGAQFGGGMFKGYVYYRTEADALMASFRLNGS